MTDTSFQHQLQIMFDNDPAEVRDQFQQTIDQVMSYVISSFEDMLVVIQGGGRS